MGGQKSYLEFFSTAFMSPFGVLILIAAILSFFIAITVISRGNGPLAGAVNPTDTAFNRAAYNHETDRDNLFNQTDFVFKTFTGPVFHTLAFGTEFGRQTGIDLRNTGIFPNGTNTIVGNPFDPTYFGPVAFVHQFPGALSKGVTTADSNSKYRLNIESAYARDTIEITR